MVTVIITTWIVLVTKLLMTKMVELATKQIIAIVIMVVTSWEVVGMKQITKPI